MVILWTMTKPKESRLLKSADNMMEALNKTGTVSPEKYAEFQAMREEPEEIKIGRTISKEEQERRGFPSPEAVSKMLRDEKRNQ